MASLTGKSKYFRLLQAVAAEFKSLDLKLIADEKIAVKKLPKNRAEWSEGLFIAPLPEIVRPADNDTEDIGYGAQCVLVLASNGDLEAGDGMDQFLYWRERSRDHFLPTRNEPLPGTDVFSITYEPGALYDQAAFDNNFDAQSFTLRLWCNEPRQQGI